MNKVKSITVVIIILLSGFILSCKKSSGVGGTSTLKGRIKVENWSLGWPGPSTFYASSYGPEISVYLIYGDSGFYSDVTKTSYDGTFEFPFLNKGKYEVFAYSSCDTCWSGKLVVTRDTEITKNRSVVDLGDVTIVKTH